MKIKLSPFLWHILLGLILLVLLFPIFWMVSLSFKSVSQISGQNPLDLWPNPWTVENFQYVWRGNNFISFTRNSFIIASGVTCLKIATGLLAAYGFSQFRFLGRKILLGACLLSMFVPFVTIMLPNYLFLSQLDLLNTYWAVILPQAADGMGIFLLYQAMRAIPKSIIESAQLDGNSHLEILVKVVLPVIRPAIFSLGIMSFINSWNEYFWPLLVLNSREMYTLPLALNLFANVEAGTDWGPLMTVATITALPPLVCYLFAQKQIVNTFLHSGVKG